MDFSRLRSLFSLPQFLERAWLPQLGQRLGPRLGWTALAVGLILFFTLLKLPDQQIGQLLLQNVNEQLQASPLPFEISAMRTRISLFPLPGLQFEEVSVRGRDSSDGMLKVEWERLKIRPSLLDFLFGRLGGMLQIVAKPNTEASLRAGFWLKGSRLAVDVELRQADLGENGLGLLLLLGKMTGKLALQGRIQAELDMTQLATLKGSTALTLARVELPAQKIMGFNVPALLIREGEIRASAGDGKAKLETLNLGKIDAGGDDVAAQASGEIALAQNWDLSTLNLKVKLRISETVNRAFFIIDAVLAAGKKPDGSYHFALSGPASAPILNPLGQ